jgi:hypothetical protein
MQTTVHARTERVAPTQPKISGQLHSFVEGSDEEIFDLGLSASRERVQWYNDLAPGEPYNAELPTGEIVTTTNTFAQWGILRCGRASAVSRPNNRFTA